MLNTVGRRPYTRYPAPVPASLRLQILELRTASRGVRQRAMPETRQSTESRDFTTKAVPAAAPRQQPGSTGGQHTQAQPPESEFNNLWDPRFSEGDHFISEVYKALRQHPQAKAAIRERFYKTAELGGAETLPPHWEEIVRG